MTNEQARQYGIELQLWYDLQTNWESNSQENENGQWYDKNPFVIPPPVQPGDITDENAIEMARVMPGRMVGVTGSNSGYQLQPDGTIARHEGQSSGDAFSKISDAMSGAGHSVSSSVLDPLDRNSESIAKAAAIAAIIAGTYGAGTAMAGAGAGAGTGLTATETAMMAGATNVEGIVGAESLTSLAAAGGGAVADATTASTLPSLTETTASAIPALTPADVPAVVPPAASTIPLSTAVGATGVGLSATELAMMSGGNNVEGVVAPESYTTMNSPDSINGVVNGANQVADTTKKSGGTDYSNYIIPGAIAATGLAGAAGILPGSGGEVTTAGGGSKLTPEQQLTLNNLLSYYNQFTGGSSLPTYGGQRVANNPTVDQSLAQLQSYRPPVNPLTDTTNATLADLISGKTATPQYMEGAYRAGIENPMIRNWQESIMPELSGQFAKKGLMYGSGREEAQQKSARTLAEASSMGRSDLQSKMEATTMANKLGAVNAASTFQNSNTNANSQSLAEILGLTGAQTTMGSIKQADSQKQLDVGYQDWLRNQPGTRPQDTLLMSILGQSTNYEPNTVVSQPDTSLTSALNALALYYGNKK